MDDQMTNQAKMPTPDQRPDLYDHYDGTPGRKLGDPTGIAVSDRLQKLIEARAAKPAAQPQ